MIDSVAPISFPLEDTTYIDNLYAVSFLSFMMIIIPVYLIENNILAVKYFKRYFLLFIKFLLKISEVTGIIDCYNF